VFYYSWRLGAGWLANQPANLHLTANHQQLKNQAVHMVIRDIVVSS
jgi:hypothetical protein